jgi:hypothetical protein
MGWYRPAAFLPNDALDERRPMPPLQSKAVICQQGEGGGLQSLQGTGGDL